MRTATVLLCLMGLTAHAGSTDDVWERTDKTLADLVAEGYVIVALDVDSGRDFASGTKMRFVLQKPLTRIEGDQFGQPAAMCTEEGRRHTCWLVSSP